MQLLEGISRDSGQHRSNDGSGAYWQVRSPDAVTSYEELICDVRTNIAINSCYQNNEFGRTEDIAME